MVGKGFYISNEMEMDVDSCAGRRVISPTAALLESFKLIFRFLRSLSDLSSANQVEEIGCINGER
jgi:hypothetical protein